MSYVKDILTETVVSTNFNCSQFGPNTDLNLGWVTLSFITIKFNVYIKMDVKSFYYYKTHLNCKNILQVKLNFLVTLFDYFSIQEFGLNDLTMQVLIPRWII